MSNRRYISIESVLYDISTTVDEIMWEESKAKEWVTKGLGKIQLYGKYKDQLALLRIEEHKSELPADVKYVNQIVYKQIINDVDLSVLKDIINLESSIRLTDSKLAEKAILLNANHWQPMQATSSNFLGAYEYNIEYSPLGSSTYNCEHEYYIYPNGCMDISARTGYMLVSYLTYPRDKKGNILIPDNENLKDALFHYYFYRYWMTRATLGDTNAANERAFHLNEFNKSRRSAAGDLNTPDLATLENIRRQVTRLVPASEAYAGLFSTLSQREKINF